MRKQQQCLRGSRLSLPPDLLRRPAEWMVWLRTHVGFDGWRLDFVKGFSGSHVKVGRLGRSPAALRLLRPLRPCPPSLDCLLLLP